MIHVRLFAAARAAAGASEAHMEAATLRDLVNAMGTTYGSGMTQVLARCSFLINGVAARDRTSDAELSDGDVVDVLPPFAGG